MLQTYHVSGVQRRDTLRNMAHLQDLVKYFMLGLRHGEILLLLSTVNYSVISRPMHTLRRILKCMGLHRRKNESDQSPTLWR